MLPELCRFSRQMESFKKFLIFLTKTDLLYDDDMWVVPLMSHN